MHTLYRVQVLVSFLFPRLLIMEVFVSYSTSTVPGTGSVFSSTVLHTGSTIPQ
jgi:hypothetical protein